MGEIWGYLSSIFFAICGFPQAIDCVRNGHSKGLSMTFLLTWTFGEVFLIFYAVALGWKIPLILNAAMNLLCLGVMLWYHYFPRKGISK